MRIEIVPTVDEIKWEQINNRTVIMIDVLRSSSTIVTALAAGCREIVTAETVGQANALQADGVLLAGERLGRTIPGFDLPNSPTAMLRTDVAGKRLVLTTTNGTRAIHKAERAADLFVGCFLNAASCMETAVARGRDVTLYCAGTRGAFSLEDALAAGCLADAARRHVRDTALCDLGRLCASAFRQNRNQLAQTIARSAAGKRLMANGYAADVELAAQTDAYGIVPLVKEGRIQAPLVS